MLHLYCLAVQAGFYSDAVECSPVTQAARVRYPAAALVIKILSPVTSGAQRGARTHDPEIKSLMLYRLS